MWLAPKLGLRFPPTPLALHVSWIFLIQYGMNIDRVGLSQRRKTVAVMRACLIEELSSGIEGPVLESKWGEGNCFLCRLSILSTGEGKFLDLVRRMRYQHLFCNARLFGAEVAYRVRNRQWSSWLVSKTTSLVLWAASGEHQIASVGSTRAVLYTLSQ